MCHTAGDRDGAFLFFFKRLVAGIGVTSECADTSLQEFTQDLCTTGAFVLEDDDSVPRPQLAGTEYSEIALPQGIGVRTVRIYADRCLIGLDMPGPEHQLRHAHDEGFEILKAVPDDPAI